MTKSILFSPLTDNVWPPGKLVYQHGRKIADGERCLSPIRAMRLTGWEASVFHPSVTLTTRDAKAPLDNPGRNGCAGDFLQPFIDPGQKPIEFVVDFDIELCAGPFGRRRVRACLQHRTFEVARGVVQSLRQYRTVK